jgi:hypothetical protein
MLNGGYWFGIPMTQKIELFFAETSHGIRRARYFENAMVSPSFAMSRPRVATSK